MARLGRRRAVDSSALQTHRPSVDRFVTRAERNGQSHPGRVEDDARREYPQGLRMDCLQTSRELHGRWRKTMRTQQGHIVFMAPLAASPGGFEPPYQG